MKAVLASGLLAIGAVLDPVPAWASEADDQTSLHDHAPSVSRLYAAQPQGAVQQEQSVTGFLEWNYSFDPAEISTIVGADWSGTSTLNAITAGNGAQISFFSEGQLGLKLSYGRGELGSYVQLPVEVTLELPVDGVVAPQETFTVSTRWSTPYLPDQVDPGAPAGALFITPQPFPLDVVVGLVNEIDFRIDTLGCSSGNCQTGEVTVPDGPIFEDLDLFRLRREFLNDVVGIQNLLDLNPDETDPIPLQIFFQLAGEVTDPLELDVLRFIKGDLAGLSRLGLGTDFSNADGGVSVSNLTSVPKGGSLKGGWLENALDLTLDLTNIAPIATGFACNCFVPLLNGTAADLAAIALAKADPSGESSRGLTALSWLGGGLGYTIVEAEVTGKYEIGEQFRLTPRPPEVRLLLDEVPVTNWVKAGEDITLDMPLTTGAWSMEVMAAPTFVSTMRILAKEYELYTEAIRLDLLFWTLGPAESNLRVGYGERFVVASRDDTANLQPLMISGEVGFPTPRTEPLVSLSGGNVVAFGGSQENCWQPDNLPPEQPSGISFDEDFGCIVSLRDLTISQSGSVTLDSFSPQPNIALTLLNSTLNGQGGNLASVTLDPNGNTSIYLTGEFRRSGLDTVDFFFDDAGSSGNQNKITVDTVHGAFIRNSLLRGLTSNENQSDVIIENGELWIENTDMVLDNITVVQGAISLQDSEAELRNLQLGGASESALRLTRDSLITTNSNASFNSSVLEIGNGSLVNVSGVFNNVGAINLEAGGWLAVLRDNAPLLSNRLTANSIDPGVVNIDGLSELADADAALTLIPPGAIDPVSLFDNQVKGSRLDTGVLLLDDGEIENHQINNIGGTLIAAGGMITDTEIAMSENASILAAYANTICSLCMVTGTGRLTVKPSGILQLDQAVFGDQVNDPNTLGINIEGRLEVISSADLIGNTVLTNIGDIYLAAGMDLEVATFRQFAGTLNIDGTWTSTVPIDITGGQISGSGTVTGDLDNRNGVLVAEGLTINGGFQQQRNGSLLLDFSVAASPVITTATAAVDGQLDIVLTQGEFDAITEGSGFEFLQYDSIEGTFKRINIEMVDGSEVEAWDATVVYGANAASIQWTEGAPTDLGELPIFMDGYEFGRTQ